MTNRTRTLTEIAIFPALMAATAGIVIPLGQLPSITLQTVFVFSAGLLLSPKNAFLSMSIYALLGAIGLPIFSGFTGGLGVVFGKNLGFLIGFIFAATFIAFMKNIFFLNKNIWGMAVILFCANIGIYILGATYLSMISNSSIALLLRGFAIYLFGDLLKISIVLYVHVRIRSHITYERSSI
jgi:biotin transport system substrate-specific component